MEMSKNLPVLLFKTRNNWHDWLDRYHGQAQGVWLKLAKKSSDKASVTYAEALDEALCYGWIDSQKQAYDNNYFLQKFTPRGVKSVWSKINVTKVEALIKSGKIQPAGLAAVEAAKRSGTWQTAYDSQGSSSMPKDFQVALDKNPKAKHFFETLDRANVYGFCWRVRTAKKPETRKARIEKFIDMLSRGEKLY